MTEHRVLIPLATADGGPGRLVEAVASSDVAPAHPAGLLPEISELQEAGLYRVGLVAREAAVQIMDAIRSRAWLGSWNAKPSSYHLRVAGLDGASLSDENAKSAGVGLAICALLARCKSARCLVIATGALSTDAGTEARIEPVGALAGKFALIGDYLRRSDSVDGQTVHLIAPVLTSDGKQTEQSHGAILTRLAETVAARGGQLQTTFAETLEDADAALGPLKTATRVTKPKAAVAVSALAAMLTLVASLNWLQSRPIILNWTWIADATAGEPRRARFDPPQRRFVPGPDCEDFNGQPQIVGGETLLLGVEAEDTSDLAAKFWSPRLFLVAASMDGALTVLDARAMPPASLADQDHLLIAVPVEDEDDVVRIAVIASRERGTSPESVRSMIRSRTETSSPTFPLDVANELRETFPGVIDFQFRVTTDATLCP